MLKSSTTKIIIVFIAIATISGILLGTGHYLTKTDDKKALIDAISSKLSHLKNLESLDVENIIYDDEYSFMNNVFISDDNTFVFESIGKGGYGGNIVLLITIKDNEIKDIIIYSATETPGLGTKVLNDEYLAQYKNVPLLNLENNFNLGKKSSSEVSKYLSPPSSNNTTSSALDGGVLAVTGATKTSNAVLRSINCAIVYYKELTK